MKSTGFTLLEIMIALAVIALGLAAAARAAGQVTAGAEQARLRTLALWVAQDRLAGHRIQAAWPNPGDTAGQAAQAGVELIWREHVAAAADPSMRVVEITVTAAAQPEYVLARITSSLSGPRP